jgi:mannose-6-phosphate isomerase
MGIGFFNAIGVFMNKSAVLQNTIQEYAWGSLSAIPELLGKTNSKNIPQAELWMGAHPKAPSRVEHNNQWISLLDLIDENPEAILGKTAVKKFNGTLPYLFKVLAASRPLSIQAHPSLIQAKEGFERENAEGIPINAPHRNYRDGNHKPECIFALTSFWALCGFRNQLESIRYFKIICPAGIEKELDALKQVQGPDGLKRFFSFLMNLDGNQRRQIILQAKENIKALAREDPVLDWVLRLSTEYPDDVGIFAPILLNLVCLEPGQAMFLAAGQLHAYLDGVGIELMANSDNVLRGGLTPKHVDVPELLNVLDFKEHKVVFLKPKNIDSCETLYPCPVEEFILSMIVLKPDDLYKSKKQRSAEILLCTDGAAELKDIGTDHKMSLKKGVSVIVPAAVSEYEMKGTAIFYKAAVPL